MQQFLPFLIIAAVILVAYITVQVFRYQIARKGLRSPFTQKLERFPGQHLMKRLDELNEEISIQAASLLAVPMGVYAVYLSYLTQRRKGRKERRVGHG